MNNKKVDIMDKENEYHTKEFIIEDNPSKKDDEELEIIVFDEKKEKVKKPNIFKRMITKWKSFNIKSNFRECCKWCGKKF